MLPVCIWPVLMVPPNLLGVGIWGDRLTCAARLAGYLVKVTLTPIMPRTESRPPFPCQASPALCCRTTSFPLSRKVLATESGAFMNSKLCLPIL